MRRPAPLSGMDSPHLITVSEGTMTAAVMTDKTQSEHEESATTTKADLGAYIG